MKKCIAFAFCLFATSAVMAQAIMPAAKPGTTKPVKVQTTTTTTTTKTTVPAVTTTTTTKVAKATVVKTTTVQTTAVKHAATRPAAVQKDGPGISGYILDGHKHPMDEVHTFIYAADSSIIASGYTDATGRYTTNTVLPGKYMVKIVYPNSRAVVISDVIIKNGVTPISLSADEPAADTSMPYSIFAPVAEKKPAARRN